MKKIIFILTLSLLLRPVFPVIDYVVNYDYISKVLCVNKDKPQMHCNGKCHLMKELAKAAENEKPASPDKNNAKHLVEELFFQDIRPLLQVPVSLQGKKLTISNYSNLYCLEVRSFVFHPPIFMT